MTDYGRIAASILRLPEWWSLGMLSVASGVKYQRVRMFVRLAKMAGHIEHGLSTTTRRYNYRLKTSPEDLLKFATDLHIRNLGKEILRASEKTERIMVTLPSEIRYLLRSVARKLKVTESQLIRDSVSSFLAVALRRMDADDSREAIRQAIERLKDDSRELRQFIAEHRARLLAQDQDQARHQEDH